MRRISRETLVAVYHLAYNVAQLNKPREMHFSAYARPSRIAPDAAVIPACSCIIFQKTRDHVLPLCRFFDASDSLPYPASLFLTVSLLFLRELLPVILRIRERY